MLLPGFGLVALVAAGIITAGSWESARWHEIPVFAICGLLAFAIQWLVFLPSFLARSERFYDLTGSATYITVTLVALLAGGAGAAQWLIACMVLIWALRLGGFLFIRVSTDGGDSRFDQIKQSGPRFLFTWTLQGLWVLVTAGAALAALTSPSPADINSWVVVGGSLWLAGFLIESVADAQKRVHRARYGSDQFIDSGLWRFSRHPNYAGEILLWLGVAIAALSLLTGWQYVTLVSPVFVYLLLTRVSGVPLLEKKAHKRWGDNPAYLRYVERTPTLFPLLKKG